MNILEKVSQNQQVQAWQAGFHKKQRQLVTGLSGSIKSLVMASALDVLHKKIFIVTSNTYTGSQLTEELRNILGDEAVHFMPFDEVIAAEFAFQSPEARSERIETMDFLLDEEKMGIVVAPVAAMRKFYPSVATWKESHVRFQVGMPHLLAHLKQQLISMGYVREAMVATPGNFSIRGNIVDIYPLTYAHPIRVEFFDEEVDSIRFFDVNTQRTIEKVEEVDVPPAREFVFSQADIAAGQRAIQENLAKALEKTIDKQEKVYLEDYFGQLLASFEEGMPSEEALHFLDLAFEKRTSLVEYLPKDALLFVDDFARLMEENAKEELEESEFLTLKLAEKKAFSTQSYGQDLYFLLKDAPFPATFFSLFHKGAGNLRFQANYPFTTHVMQQFFGQMPLLKAELERYQKGKKTVVVLAANKERAEKIASLFEDWGIVSTQVASNVLLTGTLQITIGNLSAGFEFLDEKLVVISEQELFHKAKKRKARKQNITNAERLKSYNELTVGDYVVHKNHGIGKYIGMETIEVEGIHQDYMSILYQNEDKLFIPITQLSMLHKYAASDGKVPKINKLSDNKWTKTKAKVAKQIEDIAEELIALYAEREALEGFAFSKDDAYQEEFEEAFVYVETEDQLRSAQEIKKDMERIRPMDRLLVGDVGFGKTEVALRAAFKAIQSGKQVAILVPTTILAQQHYETIVQRFENFPVNVEVLSRFRTKAQQEKTCERLKKGQVDIIVGTHRLLSKDVAFFDLGLLVVDEEQRFGVKHKEKLKQLKTQVDVLTLTATPIPRTLHMSMMGVRDLSVIETPPANRYPVQTYVMETNAQAIREAILREIHRGGQVFFLHNRVESMEERVQELTELVPEASIGYAHGQMSASQIENVLYDFIEGAYDVLVSTTIIETGVDIPNANTLFVEHAEFMGLSTLYQLRGRVGRSNRVAYAYFMYKPDKILSQESEKRLQAMKDFTDLGSGFKIAMRDLSIRGAGNLLGAQQSGFIDDIGFEMYAKMLEDAVRKRKGETVEEIVQVEIDLALDAYIPQTYIADERQKIEIYKRIRSLENEEMLEELKEDLVDRFGDVPLEVDSLLRIGEMKMYAEQIGIETIRRFSQPRKEVLTLTLSEKATQKYSGQDYFQALCDVSLPANMNVEKEKMRLSLTVPPKMTDAQWLNELRKGLKNLAFKPN